MTTYVRMNPGAGDNQDRGTANQGAMKGLGSQSMPRERILNDHVRPWLCLVCRWRVATAVQDSREDAGRYSPIFECPNTLPVPQELKNPGKMTHRRSTPGMESAVFFDKKGSVDMRINLGRRNIRVTKHLLDSCKSGSILQ